MNPFAYEPGPGPLRALSAWAKMLSLILCSLAAMRLRLLPLVFFASVAIAGPYFLGARIPDAKKGARTILVLALFAALARGLFPDGARIFAAETLPDSLVYTLRLVTVFFLGCAFFSSTRASELGDTITTIVRRVFSRAIPARASKDSTASGATGSEAHGVVDAADATVAAAGSMLQDPGMLIRMTLVFLPRAFERYRSTREAAQARGFGARYLRPASLVALLTRFIFSSMQDALHSANAMELRCYTTARTLPESHTRTGDYVAITLSACVFIFSVLH